MTYPPPLPPRLGARELEQLAGDNRHKDPGPYEPEPVGRPTTAMPDDPPTNRAGMAQVVHSLAAADKWLVDEEHWPPLAAAVVGMGGHWQAAVEVATTATTDEAAINAALARLAQQTMGDMGDLPPIPIMDVGVGLLARGARLGVFHPEYFESDVAGKLNQWWWEYSDVDELDGDGFTAVWSAMHLLEIEEFQPIYGALIALVAEADRLLPPYAVNAPFCTAFVLASFWEPPR
ncbi:hypothetical protein [Actinoplanes palleronii]|uniref:DUF4253 domain-containing protein n=1 Tax=Actinoplanes palleronii TaxID=113570 RepID=A0ABQ4BQT7_9ACTN|nr:hypothetical protein [Actinoplanes palleronii]GIE73027.1 hypothetical protein Apa02nite_091350 [Actinoplanes palleronii]